MVGWAWCEERHPERGVATGAARDIRHVRWALYYAACMQVTKTTVRRIQVGCAALYALSLGMMACRRPATADSGGRAEGQGASLKTAHQRADAAACGAGREAPPAGEERRVTPGPGQESVWDYPASPRVEPSSRHVQVTLGGVVIADSHRPLRLLERGHPPVFYIPSEDIRWPYFVTTTHRTTCEYKGEAHYFHIRAGGRTVEEAAWSYPDPSRGYEAIRNHVAIYPGRVAEAGGLATVDGEPVRPEREAYFGGWVTHDIAEGRP
jgi:uncharacterized protein (DUF427 family)